ncbi:hypothetical protein YC2023_050424 [Brassica napus]
MVKCTSVGEIEEEDGTIMVAHPSFIVMTTYFMGLGRYTIVMGKALQIDLGLVDLERSGDQNSSSVCYGLRVLSVKLDEVNYSFISNGDSIWLRSESNVMFRFSFMI